MQHRHVVQQKYEKQEVWRPLLLQIAMLWQTLACLAYFECIAVCPGVVLSPFEINEDPLGARNIYEPVPNSGTNLRIKATHHPKTFSSNMSTLYCSLKIRKV